MKTIYNLINSGLHLVGSDEALKLIITWDGNFLFQVWRQHLNVFLKEEEYVQPLSSFEIEWARTIAKSYLDGYSLAMEDEITEEIVNEVTETDIVYFLN